MAACCVTQISTSLSIIFRHNAIRIYNIRHTNVMYFVAANNSKRNSAKMQQVTTHPIVVLLQLLCTRCMYFFINIIYISLVSLLSILTGYVRAGHGIPSLNSHILLLLDQRSSSWGKNGFNNDFLN